MCQAHVKSQIQFCWNVLVLKIWIGYLPFFLQNYDPHGPWDPSYSIPGEKRILEFFEGGGRKKQVPWAPWRGPTPLYLDRVNVTCRYNFSRPWFHVITSLPSPHMVNGRCHRLNQSIAALLIFAACTHMFLKVSSQLQHNSTSELGLGPNNCQGVTVS